MVALRATLLLWIIKSYAQGRSWATPGNQTWIPLCSIKTYSNRIRVGAGWGVLGWIG